MTNGPSQTTPPPPPAGGSPQGVGGPPPAPQKKKGLSPLAWIGIGCGAILLLSMIAFVVLGGWLFGKAKDAVQEFEENPALASAKLIVRADPDLEIVDSDDEADTVTIRNTETGEVITVDMEDIEEGRISFEKDGERTNVGFEEDEEGGGSFTVRDDEGRSRFRVGSGGDEEIPGWIPRYAGVEPEGSFISSTDQKTEGGFGFKVEDDLDEVVAFYEDELEGAGFEITGRNSWSGGGSRGTSITAEDAGRSVQVMIMGEGGTSQVTITFSDEQE